MSKIELHQILQQCIKYQRERLPRLPDFLLLMRLDKPIGIFLLLWPTLWGLWIANEGWPGIHLLTVFVLGVVLMRSAGCVMNDFADRNFDAHVERTQDRPIATGRIHPKEALLFCGILSLLAFALVMTTNLLTVQLSFAAILIAFSYPFMKRFTYMPQVFLGIAFAWGIPMAFAATSQSIPLVAWLLMTAAIVWTVVYDTEYAMVDREDDIRLGLKSTAILFGDLDRLMIAILQFVFIGTMLLLHRHLELGWYFNLSLVAAALLMFYQQTLIRKRERLKCFKAFLNNHWVGLAIFVGFVAEFATLP
jgi:4-hydroxybenzoate polyprenyltransferase